MEMKRGLKLVAIGGGTGLSTLLAGLKSFVGTCEDGIWLDSLSAIVTVSDDGGSSGRLREELQMLPPGDIRNCMIALSEDSNLLSKLFRYRFGGTGDLAGHSFGNLFLAALTEVTGDFVEAVRLSSEVLASKGHIYPATITDVRLIAELEDGREVLGESQITAARGSIRRLRLEPPHCLPLPLAITAIHDADVITIGPGSLFTSILPNLLVSGVADAIAKSRAIKLFIANLMTQPGETEGYDLRLHLETVTAYAPQIEFDAAVVNHRKISAEQAEIYAADGAFQIDVDQNFNELGVPTLRADLLDQSEKVRHNSARLAKVVLTYSESFSREQPVLATV
jgi:uncharacterized cofD-like protein